MDAILLVGHGSRDPEGNEELLHFADEVRHAAPGYNIETCFLELVEPDIGEGIESCVRLGATRVIIIPIMLFAAAHAKIHIPYEIGEAGKRYPAVEFVYGRPIGVHQKVMDILTSRMESAGFPANNAEFPIELSRREPDTAVLLIGRGSSDRDANGDFYKMSRLLWERLPVRWVENCFIGVTEPTFEEGLERCLALGAKKVFILPYFLFTGVLMKRIQEMTADFALRYPDIELELAGYFGSHPKLVEMLLERVEEALGGQAYMNCGTCDYRQNVSHEHGHAHGHSHEHHHGHEHSHSHEHHGHSHSHADAHHHSHTHSHEHHHGHSHAHSQDHHGHGHSHEHHHGHSHAHSQDHHGHGHSHEQYHDHQHGHQQAKQHSYGQGSHSHDIHNQDNGAHAADSNVKNEQRQDPPCGCGTA